MGGSALYATVVVSHQQQQQGHMHEQRHDTSQANTEDCSWHSVYHSEHTHTPVGGGGPNARMPTQHPGNNSRLDDTLCRECSAAMAAIMATTSSSSPGWCTVEVPKIPHPGLGPLGHVRPHARDLPRPPGCKRTLWPACT